MDKERQNKTLTLSELLDKGILGDKLNKTAYSEIAKQATIFSFWNNIAGKKLANLSKPYKIKNSKLYIATKSATVSQQIMFVKNNIINKINSFSKPLGIEIKEIAVNYKNYDELTSNKEIPAEEKPVFIREEELDGINLPDEIIKNINSAVDKITFISDEQKKLLKDKILNSYKAQQFREKTQNKT